MDEARPIDRYRGCISNLQGLSKEFQNWSELSPMRHQLILWQGPGDPPTTEAWKEFLLEVGIFPFEANTPDDNAEFHFLPDASRCNSFRWRETPEIRDGEFDILLDFEHLALDAYGGLSSMLKVHEWYLPGAECKVPKWFWPGRDPGSGMIYPWLQVLYESASEWPAVSDAPAWMPTTRDLVGKKAIAKLVESQDVWMLSAEAISRWLPPDVDDFMAAGKAAAYTAPKPYREKEKPNWDGEARRLTYKGCLIKEFNQPSENQTLVLASFQEDSWPNQIFDPLPPKACIAPKERLGDTVDALNDHHKTPGKMHFGRVGTGEGIRWCDGPKPLRPPSKKLKP